MALLTQAQQRQVEEAVTRAEQRTDAEIVTVLAPRADDYSYIPLLWASLIALLVPALAHFYKWPVTYFPVDAAMGHVRVLEPALSYPGHHHTFDPPPRRHIGARATWRVASFLNKTAPHRRPHRGADFCQRGRALRRNFGG